MSANFNQSTDDFDPHNANDLLGETGEGLGTPLEEKDSLEAAIARAHPADEPVVKLREIAHILTDPPTTLSPMRRYQLAKWLDNWLDRYSEKPR